MAGLTSAEANYRQSPSDNVPFIKHCLHPCRPLCFNQAVGLSRSLVVSSRSLAVMQKDSRSPLHVFFSKVCLFLPRLRPVPVSSTTKYACMRFILCERAHFEVQKLEMVTF